MNRTIKYAIGAFGGWLLTGVSSRAVSIFEFFLEKRSIGLFLSNFLGLIGFLTTIVFFVLLITSILKTEHE